jgi:hypothetical protein
MIVQVRVNIAPFTVKVIVHCYVAIVVRPCASMIRIFCDKGCTDILRLFTSVCEMKSRDAQQSKRTIYLAAGACTLELTISVLKTSKGLFSCWFVRLHCTISYFGWCGLLVRTRFARSQNSVRPVVVGEWGFCG